MEYALGIDGAPATVPAGSAVLLVHPSTVAADGVDTEFLADNDDPVLVVSTHSAAREVRQKLAHFGIDRDRVEILDAISVERGYTRRQDEDVTYLTAPDDLDGMVEGVADFLADQDGPARVTLDSLTELIYYADASQVGAAIEEVLDLLDAHEALGLFHLASGVHDDAIGDVRDRFAGVVELDESGDVTATF
jgi:KaiC/GvpD/RAD55 family RecA-like ATPase